jgi:hypothetical protein
LFDVLILAFKAVRVMLLVEVPPKELGADQVRLNVRLFDIFT